MTTAAAMPASWETDRCQPVTPSPAAAAATVSTTDSTGRPEDSEITRQSCHSMPAGTPNALSPSQDCASKATPTNDVEGLNEGYIVVDAIPLAPGTGG